ncbi:maleylacetoacetate isomerase [Lysobacter sp. CAU 1642]|uniref:Maleylacetoacetate isomerase n=1 Tax=Pseudomarimonas salicorniae TaxID=2933270 RepID=A0ABT0GCB9_9GAMM|nr:maleylacetoacetate isomerase [Lysobacter sp. CAU 1642]MCK7592193.1 maleylacetoacetate isomerase [Lysobacter sp. CAU 1642]
MNGTLTLYSYWRSSAAYRVRIGLQLKRLPHEIAAVHLLRDGGEQHGEAYQALNPQELVPTLKHGQRVIRQSLAILEYLEETFPDQPIMPATARDRARVRAISQMVACDIHPLNNLRILQFFENGWNVPQPEREAWVRRWIQLGFAAVESLLADNPSTGEFCEGDLPSMADCCLIPQVYNARRFGVDMSEYPTIERIDRRCLEMPEFDLARPENQPDAPPVTAPA